MQVTGKTGVYAIFGKPVEHSFSPIIQNAAFEEEKIDGVYVAFEPANLKEAVESIRNLSIRGCSITIPFKIDILPLLDEIDSLAAKIGAVNTVWNNRGKLIGYNTDGLGALKALEEATTVRGKSVAILGFGGAARAIAFALTQKKPSQLLIWGLTGGEGEKLAREVQKKTQVPSSFSPIQNQVVYDILINATPVGMWPKVDASPIPGEWVLPEKTVFDIIYRPKETRLLQIAATKKCKTIYGYKMLLYQGAEQFRIWTGRKAPLKTMEQALLHVLRSP